MYRGEEFFISELKKDSDLETVFRILGDQSTIKQDNDNFAYFEAFPQSLESLVHTAKERIQKSDGVIQRHIDKLIRWGLVEYVTDDDAGLPLQNDTEETDEQRVDFFAKLGFPKEKCNIVITRRQDIGCSGLTLYQKILRDEEYEIAKEEAAALLERGLDDILTPYKQQVESLQSEIKEKMTQVSKEVDNGIVKNIQVLSVFAGIISLLFANIMGIKEFAAIGLTGLVLINALMVTAIFALLLFCKWLILGERIKWTNFACCIIIILVLLSPIAILFFTGFKMS